ncbi:MAG: Tol-Pal system beta propeller repeat protein TolB, partial [Alphaproteobacteria bacterium]|nr:Tol-Pal system beta propeller repeat protein TolB [Alphaproteobacteria bacterium]
SPAVAQLEIDITEGVVEPLPIAISEFYGDNPEAVRFGRNIANVVSADLESSGLLRPLDRRAFIQSPEELRNLPRFADWRQINAQALVTGTVIAGDGATDITVEFRLWDVFAGSQMRGLRFSAAEDQWRRVAHRIADAVYQRITGEDGYFDSQIVYVSETGSALDRIKRIAVMDQDGANHRFLTDGSDLVLTPRFDPEGTSIAYMAYRGRIPQIYERSLLTNTERPFGNFPGMTFAPQFSPDGERLAMSLAINGNTDLYLLDLENDQSADQRQRLTTSQSIETSPSFSPGGSEIVFNSDRAGSPQLYVMDVDGSEPVRISFGGGNYGSPAWSPRGDLIAFTKIKDGLFHIGVMRTDGSDERLLTRSALDEGPTWAPNGRVILFSRKDYATNRIRLFTIDVTGYNERELPTPLDASDPDWSTLIP